jgi:hypothetical protein
MKQIKEPLTRDYAAYGILTLALAGTVVGAHYFVGGLDLVERSIASFFESLRNLEPWKALLVAAFVIALVAIELVREARPPEERDRIIIHHHKTTPHGR